MMLHIGNIPNCTFGNIPDLRQLQYVKAVQSTSCLENSGGMKCLRLANCRRLRDNCSRLGMIFVAPIRGRFGDEVLSARYMEYV